MPKDRTITKTRDQPHLLTRRTGQHPAPAHTKVPAHAPTTSQLPAKGPARKRNKCSNMVEEERSDWDHDQAARLIAQLEKEFTAAHPADIEAVVCEVMKLLPDAESPILLERARELLIVD